MLSNESNRNLINECFQALFLTNDFDVQYDQNDPDLKQDSVTQNTDNTVGLITTLNLSQKSALLEKLSTIISFLKNNRFLENSPPSTDQTMKKIIWLLRNNPEYLEDLIQNFDFILKDKRFQSLESGYHTAFHTLKDALDERQHLRERAFFSPILLETLNQQSTTLHELLNVEEFIYAELPKNSKINHLFLIKTCSAFQPQWILKQEVLNDLSCHQDFILIVDLAQHPLQFEKIVRNLRKIIYLLKKSQLTILPDLLESMEHCYRTILPYSATENISSQPDYSELASATKNLWVEYIITAIFRPNNSNTSPVVLHEFIANSVRNFDSQQMTYFNQILRTFIDIGPNIPSQEQDWLTELMCPLKESPLLLQNVIYAFQTLLEYVPLSQQIHTVLHHFMNLLNETVAQSLEFFNNILQEGALIRELFLPLTFEINEIHDHPSLEKLSHPDNSFNSFTQLQASLEHFKCYLKQVDPPGSQCPNEDVTLQEVIRNLCSMIDMVSSKISLVLERFNMQTASSEESIQAILTINEKMQDFKLKIRSLLESCPHIDSPNKPNLSKNSISCIKIYIHHLTDLQKQQEAKKPTQTYNSHFFQHSPSSKIMQEEKSDPAKHKSDTTPTPPPSP